MYNIPIEFGVPMKLVRLIKMCLTEAYSRVRVDKHLSDFSYWEWFETRRCFVTIAIRLCFRVCH